MRIIKILEEEDVKGFNRAAPKHEIVMAGFFMVNCPACEAFKPEWDKFVNSCESQEDPKVLIAEIDSNQASRVNFDTSALEGFPTVYRDVKGEEGVVEFKHERTKKALHRFLKEAMAAKGGGKKRRKKRKTKKRRKSRRKKKKGGVNNSCALASYNPPEATPQEGNTYCLEHGGQGKPKCNINTGLCIPPRPPQPLPAHMLYIDPRDIPGQVSPQVSNGKSKAPNTLNAQTRMRAINIRQLRGVAQMPPASPLHRVRNSRTSSGNITARPPPPQPHWARQPPSADALHDTAAPLVRIPTRGPILSPPTFVFGTFTPEELGSREVVDGGYKRKKRKKRRKTRKKRRKRKTKRKRR